MININQTTITITLEKILEKSDVSKIIKFSRGVSKKVLKVRKGTDIEEALKHMQLPIDVELVAIHDPRDIGGYDYCIGDAKYEKIVICENQQPELIANAYFLQREKEFVNNNYYPKYYLSIEGKFKR